MSKLKLAITVVLTALLLSSCATTPDSRYKMVNLEEARTLHERDALFIDIRSAHFFNKGHIPGAANLDARRFTVSSLARIANRDQEIVIYCYGIACPLSEQATSKAVLWGYQNVYLFMKGYPAWWGAGYPIEKSS